MILEESPVGDSQANGEGENAIKRIAGQFRARREATESRYQRRIQGDHPILPWMIDYSIQQGASTDIKLGKMVRPTIKGGKERIDLSVNSENALSLSG